MQDVKVQNTWSKLHDINFFSLGLVWKCLYSIRHILNDLYCFTLASNKQLSLPIADNVCCIIVNHLSTTAWSTVITIMVKLLCWTVKCSQSQMTSRNSIFCILPDYCPQSSSCSPKRLYNSRVVTPRWTAAKIIYKLSLFVISSEVM